MGKWFWDPQSGIAGGVLYALVVAAILRFIIFGA
jgi:hypothetical protein